jgi:hypothetical protein
MHTLPNVVALGMYLFSNKQEQKRAQEKKYHTHLPSAPRRLRHPVAVAANLPKPHLTKEGDRGRGGGWQPYNTVGGEGGGSTVPVGVPHA